MSIGFKNLYKIDKSIKSDIDLKYFSSGSIGLNATVNHSSGSGDRVMEQLEIAQFEPRARLNSTSQGDQIPEFQPNGECDQSQCTPECSR